MCEKRVSGNGWRQKREGKQDGRRNSVSGAMGEEGGRLENTEKERIEHER